MAAPRSGNGLTRVTPMRNRKDADLAFAERVAEVIDEAVSGRRFGVGINSIGLHLYSGAGAIGSIRKGTTLVGVYQTPASALAIVADIRATRAALAKGEVKP